MPSFPGDADTGGPGTQLGTALVNPKYVQGPTHILTHSESGKGVESSRPRALSKIEEVATSVENNGLIASSSSGHIKHRRNEENKSKRKELHIWNT